MQIYGVHLSEYGPWVQVKKVYRHTHDAEPFGHEMATDSIEWYSVTYASLFYL